jgi:hypothetical protein
LRGRIEYWGLKNPKIDIWKLDIFSLSNV